MDLEETVIRKRVGGRYGAASGRGAVAVRSPSLEDEGRTSEASEGFGGAERFAVLCGVG